VLPHRLDKICRRSAGDKTPGARAPGVQQF
jgi:hypothetical protein